MVENFFLEGGVGKGGRDSIEIRFKAVLEALREKWADVYNELGWDKSWASKVRRGLVIPPEWQRIQLAKRLKIDSTVIWKVQDIISNNSQTPKIEGVEND